MTTLVAVPALPVVEAVLHPRFLTLVERETIADLRRAGSSLLAIGHALGRPASTIKRELDARFSEGSDQPHAAHRAWAGSRARPKSSKLSAPSPLRDYVQAKLLLRWSPEQISHTLLKEFPDDESMRVSPETIYQALYVQARGGLKREVAAALRSGRTRRKPHRHPDQRTSRFVDEMVMISERPPEIEDVSEERRCSGEGANRIVRVAPDADVDRFTSRLPLAQAVHSSGTQRDTRPGDTTLWALAPFAPRSFRR